MLSVALNQRDIKQNVFTRKTYLFLTFLLSTFIVGIFTIYHINENKILFYFGLIVLFSSAILLKPDYFFLVFVFLIPNVFVIKQIDVSTAYIGYAFLISIAKYLLTNKRNVKPPYILFLHALLVLIPILGYLDLSLLASLIRFFAVALFLFSFYDSDYYKNKDYKDALINFFIFGTVMNVAVGLLYYNLKSLNLFWMSFSGIRSDRNYFSAVIADCLAVTFAYSISAKRKIIYLFTFVFLLFGGLLSGSRAFLVSLVWVFLMLIYFLFSKKYWKQCVVIVLILLIACFVLRDQLFPATQKLISRFGEDNLSSGSGRIDSWKYYLGIFTSNPLNFLFGSSSKIPRFGGESGIVEHNTFVQALSEIGLLGTVSLLLIFYVLYKKMIVNKRIKIVFFGPLFVITTCYFFINSMYSDTFTILVFLCYGLLDLNSEEKFRGSLNENITY